MAELTPQVIDLDGLELTYASANAGGDVFDNDGSKLLFIDNGDTSEITVTIAGQNSCNMGTVHDETYTIPAGEERIIGYFSPYRFNDENGQVNISISGADTIGDVQLAVARI